MAAGRATSLMMALVGLLLVGLMIYALSLGGQGLPSLAPASESSLVAVYFPDTSSWHEFRRALVESAARGLADVVERTAGTIRLRCKRSRHELRFQWYDEPGLLAARASLRTLRKAENPPLAVIGSTNTALTTALADELADAAKSPPTARPAPILLIPSATAVLVPEPSADGLIATSSDKGKRALLGIYPRALRFCLNNQQMADLVATVASKLDEGPPARALVVVDPNDPFSADLAQCFTASLEQLDPQTRIIWREWMPSPGRAFGTLEGDAAEMLSPLLEENVKARAGTRDWLVLTVQGSPARQVLQSLRDLGPEHRVRVLAGDGIGRTTLESFAGQLPFPLCAATSVSAEVPGWLMSPQGQVGQTQAELATALLAVFDESGPGADLLPALAALHWTRDSAHAVGRSLVFADRDRAGDDVGQVLEIVPGSRHVLSHAPVSSGEAAAAKLSVSAAHVDSAARPRP